jgi:predicted ABC-type ATPase
LRPKSLTVVAGPNGSGKSTLIEHLVRQGIDLGEYINADDIVKERGLVGDEGAREGQLLADEARDRCLNGGIDFSFETVMSHVSKVEFMAKAKSMNFEVNLFFVATSDPLLNVERVSARVAQGGHDVPIDRILARYQRTIALLPQAIAACSVATIFDNSKNAALGKGGLRPILQVTNGFSFIELVFRTPVPDWLLRSLDFSMTKWCFINLWVDADGTVHGLLHSKGESAGKCVEGENVASSLIYLLDHGTPGEVITLNSV